MQAISNLSSFFRLFRESVVNLVSLSWVVKLPTELEQAFLIQQKHKFAKFLRYMLVFGFFAYGLPMAWDAISGSKMFMNLLVPRLVMIVFFAIAFIATFHKKFYEIGQYVGMLFVVFLMLNITWVQQLLEKGLEEGYGMLITPGASSSVIIFSGAEMGYGALLTPLLMLPIGFSAWHTFIVSVVTIVAVNIGMHQSTLPAAFVQTSNSVFISIGVFTTILAFLVNQQRRAAFQLEHSLVIARDEAQEASKAKSTFLAMMSHEVRTPLNGVLGMANLLLDTRLDRQQTNYLQTVKYSGETLLAMLNDILDFSKMEAGKFDIEKLDIDLVRLTNSVTDIMRSRAQEKGIDVRVSIGNNVPHYIHTDPTRLRQVMLNLLSNAIKFTDKGYVMTEIVNMGQEGDIARLRFNIIDTGIGIPESVKNKLFKEFTQADSSTSRKYGGTGLGLSICKKIVELLEGHIQADSVEGKGSTFWFEIPVKAVSGNNYIDPERKSAEVIDLAPAHILVVDDNEINLQVAHDTLKKGGHRIDIANSGKEAIASVEKNLYDIIFMDMQMPEMDGVEAVRIIKSMGEDIARIPIIALTANVLKEGDPHISAAGMVDHVTKPFDPRRLSQVIAQHVPGKLLIGKRSDSGFQEQSLRNEKHDTNKLDLKVLSEYEEMFGRDYILKNVLGNFIPKIQKYLSELSEKEKTYDNDHMRNRAHDLKSMCSFCGLIDAAATAEHIESLYNEGKGSEAESLVGLMNEEFQAGLKILLSIYPANITQAA